MSGSQITDYKAPQWFRMQTHPAPAGLFCTFPGEGALLHRRGFGIASPEVQSGHFVACHRIQEIG